MRRKLSRSQQVACGFLILPTILLAQHQGPVAPLARTPARTFTPPAAPLLWGRSGPANHPGTTGTPANGSRHHGDDHQHLPYRAPYPYVFGYGLPLAYGFGGNGFTGDGMNGDGIDGDDQDTVTAAPPPPASAPDDTTPELAANAPPLYRPYYQEPPILAPVHPQPATTLIFKDGRPSKEIHNYALIAETLYALDDDRRQEIPLSQLDIPATIVANRAAGVDFALPVNR